MNIKVAAFTGSEKSSNTSFHRWMDGHQSGRYITRSSMGRRFKMKDEFTVRAQ